MSQIERNRAGIPAGLYSEWGRTYDRYHGNFPGFSGFGATLPLPAPIPKLSWPDGRSHTLPQVIETGRFEEAKIYASKGFHAAYRFAQQPASNRVQDRWINAANLYSAAYHTPAGRDQFVIAVETIKAANRVSDEAYAMQQREASAPATTSARADDTAFSPAATVPVPTTKITVSATPPSLPMTKPTPTSTSSISVRTPKPGPTQTDPSTYLDFTVGPSGPSPIAPGVKTPEVVHDAGFFANLPWWALPAAAAGAYLLFSRR